MFLTRINTPPPCLFLSFLYTEKPGGKISEFKMESSKCDSVPIKMSILCNNIKSFTLLCKVCSAVTLSNRISLKIAVLVEYA